MDARPERLPRGAARRTTAILLALVLAAGTAAAALLAERRPTRVPASTSVGVPKRPRSAYSALEEHHTALPARCSAGCRGVERAEPAQPCAATCR